MAARRTPGLLYLVVALVAGNVFLAVTAYWFWQELARADERAVTAVQERDKARQTQQAALDRLNAVKLRVNRSTELDFEQFLAAADDDIQQFGGGLPNETYGDVVRRLKTWLDDARLELQQIVADKERIERDYGELEGIKRAGVNEAAAATQQARQDLMKERSEFVRQIDGKDQQIASIMDKANTLAAKLETEQREKSKVREELLTQVNKLRRILIEARAPFTPDALAKQKPDGKVVRASAATKTAWINIGSKHGVQPQLTFSVQPAGFNGNPYTKPKAKLEVVRVTSETLSEARIVEQSLGNPVLEGDLIFNPAWDPGKVRHFALAGLFDLEGDGRDARARVRAIIENSGAKIDAEVLPDGTETGEVTVETNYFVRGVRPDPEHAGPIELKVLTAMAKMERTALDYGAVVIDLGKFLDLMGYSHTNRLRSESPAPPRLAPVDNPSIRKTTPNGNAARPSK